MTELQKVAPRRGRRGRTRPRAGESLARLPRREVSRARDPPEGQSGRARSGHGRQPALRSHQPRRHRSHRKHGRGEPAARPRPAVHGFHAPRRVRPRRSARALRQRRPRRRRALSDDRAGLAVPSRIPNSPMPTPVPTTVGSPTSAAVLRAGSCPSRSSACSTPSLPPASCAALSPTVAAPASHPDHPADWQSSLQRMVEPLSAETTAKVAGDNAIRLYGVGSG